MESIFFCVFVQGPEEQEESDSDPAPTEQAKPRSSEVGCVMTEEEYEEWKKEREGGKKDELGTGIDWGMGEIKLSDLKMKISNNEEAFPSQNKLRKKVLVVGAKLVLSSYHLDTL